MKTLLRIALVFGAFPFTLVAQLNPSPIIAGAKSDINYLGSNYLQPLSDAMAGSLTNGWYNTAKVRKLGNFHLGLNTMAMIVPDAMTSYRIDPAQLQALELVDPNNDIAPTAFGDRSPGPELEYSDPRLLGFAGSRFNTPPGYGFSIFPMANLQASVGLSQGIELKLRYLPTLEIPTITGSQIGMWGAGLQYDLLRHIPDAKALPFSASLLGAYTSFSFGQVIESGTDKRLDLEATAYTTRLLISKKLAFLTFYGGVGYNSVTSQLDVSGTYEYIDPLSPLNPRGEIKDPISFSSDAASGWAVNAGLRLKFLWVAYAAVDYTAGPFDALTASLGVSVDF